MRVEPTLPNPAAAYSRRRPARSETDTGANVRGKLRHGDRLEAIGLILRWRAETGWHSRPHNTHTI